MTSVKETKIEHIPKNNGAFMKMNTLKKLYLCLKYELPKIEVDPELAKKAIIPINRMLELSK